MVYLALRDGKVKMPLIDPTIKSDGTIWMNGMPLLGITDPKLKDQASEAAKRKAWNEIPADAFTKVGVNPNGLTIIKQSDYMAAQEANLTPAQKMRREINDLLHKAEKLANSRSEDNVSGPMMLRSKANKMLGDWRRMYPEEAAKEGNRKLLDKANALRDKAVYAMTYDADGSLSHADQKERHDDYIRQAEKLEAQARQQ